MDNFAFDTAKLLFEPRRQSACVGLWGRTPLYTAIDIEYL